MPTPLEYAWSGPCSGVTSARHAGMMARCTSGSLNRRWRTQTPRCGIQLVTCSTRRADTEPRWVTSRSVSCHAVHNLALTSHSATRRSTVLIAQQKGPADMLTIHCSVFLACISVNCCWGQPSSDTHAEARVVNLPGTCSWSSCVCLR